MNTKLIEKQVEAIFQLLKGKLKDRLKSDAEFDPKERFQIWIFADNRTPARMIDKLYEWCDDHLHPADAAEMLAALLVSLNDGVTQHEALEAIQRTVERDKTNRGEFTQACCLGLLLGLGKWTAAIGNDDAVSGKFLNSLHSLMESAEHRKTPVSEFDGGLSGMLSNVSGPAVASCAASMPVFLELVYGMFFPEPDKPTPVRSGMVGQVIKELFSRYVRRLDPTDLLRMAVMRS